MFVRHIDKMKMLPQSIVNRLKLSFTHFFFSTSFIYPSSFHCAAAGNCHDFCFHIRAFSSIGRRRNFSFSPLKLQVNNNKKNSCQEDRGMEYGSSRETGREI